MKRIYAFLLLLFLATPAQAAWVEKNTKPGAAGSGNPWTIQAFSNALTPGTIILVSVGSSANPIPTPTDTAGNTYLDCGAGEVAVGGGGYYIQTFYALNTHTTASNQISFSNSGGYTYWGVASEWSGNRSTSPIDVVSSTANGITTSGNDNVTSGAATTTVDGELIYGWERSYGGAMALGTGFSWVYNSDYPAEYAIQSSAGSIAVTWTNTGGSGIHYGAIMTTIKPPTPSNYSAPITENLLTNDTLSRSGNFSRGLSESNPTSESLARVAAFGRGTTESNSTSDLLNRAANFSRNPTENNPAGDGVARLGIFGRSLTETNLASDELARLGAFGRAVTETSTSSDQLASSAGRFANLEESNAASDTLTRLGVFGRGLTETYVASDELARLGAFGRGLTDSYVASDELARLGMFGRAVTETGTSSDLLASSAGRFANLEESNAASDTLTRLGVFGRGLTETYVASDELARTRGAFVAVAESLMLNDSLNMRLVQTRHVEPRHSFKVPGRTKTGMVPGRSKTGTAPVH